MFLLNPVWIKVGAGILGALLVAALVCYFESVNRHEQADRRFARDPQVAAWYQEAKELVTSQRTGAGSKSLSRPVALWYGKIGECRNSNPRSGTAPELLAVRLADARLMAGEKGRHDGKGKEVIISTRNASVSPRVGEEWLFSVWRDGEGYNHTKSACFYRPPRGT